MSTNCISSYGWKCPIISPINILSWCLFFSWTPRTTNCPSFVRVWTDTNRIKLNVWWWTFDVLVTLVDIKISASKSLSLWNSFQCSHKVELKFYYHGVTWDFPIPGKFTQTRKWTKVPFTKWLYLREMLRFYWKLLKLLLDRIVFRKKGGEPSST